MHKGRTTKSPRRSEKINLCPVSPNRRPRVTGDVVNMRHVARERVHAQLRRKKRVLKKTHLERMRVLTLTNAAICATLYDKSYHTMITQGYTDDERQNAQARS
jgi:hypothetical protein